MAWERVLTVNDFWDGPRRGIAEVSWRAHIYESPFNTRKDDFEEFFWFQPIDPDLLALVLEDWDIWNRWSDGFDRGAASQETHPALPQDRTHHDILPGGGNSDNDSALAGTPGLDSDIRINPGDRIPLTPRHMLKSYADVPQLRTESPGGKVDGVPSTCSLKTGAG